MADYVVRVEAATDKAERDLSRVEQYIKRVDRKVKVDVQLPNIAEVTGALSQFGRVAADVGKQALQLSRQLNVGPGAVLNDLEDLFQKVSISGQKAANSMLALKDATPTRILGASFDVASAKALGLSRSIATVGFEVFGLTQSVNILKQAFGGFFNETIGREIRLQEALLQTKTTLISTADVIQSGTRLTDPFKALQALEQPIEDTLESIRRRSLDIAGTTSDAIVSVFGVVAAQIGGIGGSLKDAEDLAISFAGALGTIGMADPVLANQEIRSILSGTIDRNSRLAVMLGLTNEEVQKAKSSADGLIGFLKKRLEGFTAGQKTAAQQFAGITSNIQEVREEMSRAFGKPILEPLLVGLTEVYTRLSAIFDQLKAISGNAGQAVANVATVLQQSVAQAPALQGFGGKTDGFVRAAEEATADFAQKVRASMDEIRPLLARLISEVIEGIARITQGLGALLAGFASFKFEQFKILATTFANMATILNNTVIPAIQAVLNLYGQLLAMPLVQYLNQVAATHGVLERLGVNSIVRLIGTWRFYQESINIAIGWIQKFDSVVRGALQGALNAIAGAIQGIGSAVSGGLIAAMEGLAALMGRVFGTAVVLVQRLGQVFITVSQNIAQVYPALAPLAPILERIGKSMFYVEEAIRKAGLSFKKFAVDAAKGLEVVKVKADATATSVRNLGTVIGTQLVAGLKKLGAGLRGLLVGFIKLQLLLFAMQAATAALTEAFGRYQRAKERATASKATERSLELLETKYRDLGDAMSEADKRMREFHLSMVENRYAQNLEQIEKLSAALEKVSEEASKPGINSFGEAMRVSGYLVMQMVEELMRSLDNLWESIQNVFRSISESKLARVTALLVSLVTPTGMLARNIDNTRTSVSQLFPFLEGLIKLLERIANNPVFQKGLFSFIGSTLLPNGAGLVLGKLLGGAATGGALDNANKQEQEALEKELAEIRDENKKIEALRERERQAASIELAKKAREDGLKELKEYEWQLERQLFAKTQELKRQGLQLEQQEGAFRISQIERANELQIEGVEGAAAAGLKALNEYLTNKAEGELELQTMEKELTIQLADLERQVVDYRYEMEKKIAEIRKRAAQYDAQAAAGAGSGGGTGGLTGNSGRSTGPHLDVRGTNREAVINEAMQHIQTWQAMGVEYIQLSNIRQDVKNITDPAKLRSLVEREMAKHGSRVSKGTFAVDIAVPVNTPVNARLGTPSFDGGGGGWIQTNLDTGNQLLHMSPDSTASPIGGSPSAGGGGRLSLGQLKGLAMKAGFTEAQASIMAAIAMGESSGNPSAHNPDASTGDNSYGAWQINMLGNMGPDRRLKLGIPNNEALFDPATNARAAKMLFDEAGGSFTPWSVYKGGQYRKWLAQAQATRPDASAPSATGGAANNAPVDAGLDFSKIEEMRVNWEATVNRIGELLKKSLDLRKKIQEAKTLQELQDLGKKAFPDIPLEGYDDQLIGLQEKLTLLRAAGDEAYNPQRIDSAAVAQTKLTIAAREYAEIKKKLAELTDPATGEKLTAEQAQKALESFTKQYEKVQKQVEEERKKTNEVADAALILSSVETLNASTRSIGFATRGDILRKQTDMAKAYVGPDDLLKQRMLDADLQVALKRLELEEKHNGNLEKIIPELERYERATYEAAEQLAAMDEVVEEFAEGMERAREATDTIVGGLKGGLSDALAGGDLKEAAAGMTRSIADGFVDMMLDYAFKPMEEMLMKTFKDLFGVKDPEEEKRKATVENTVAIKELTAAITTGGASGAANNIVGFNLDKPLVNLEGVTKQFDKLDLSLEKLPKNLTATAFSMEQITDAAEVTAPAQEKAAGAMQKYVTGLGSIATAALGIVGGIQQIKEGGTGNVLMGIGSIFTGIAGGISGFSSIFRASGGGVNMGQSKIVGENGPEIFVAPENGRIGSNAELRDAMRGSSSSRAAGGTDIRMSFQTTKFMDREWVDREQLEEAMDRARRDGARQGAREGADRAIEKLMQSPRTRQRVGI